MVKIPSIDANYPSFHPGFLNEIEGYTAALGGAHFQENPYATHSAERVSWFIGWISWSDLTIKTAEARRVVSEHMH